MQVYEFHFTIVSFLEDGNHPTVEKNVIRVRIAKTLPYLVHAHRIVVTKLDLRKEQSRKKRTLIKRTWFLNFDFMLHLFLYFKAQIGHQGMDGLGLSLFGKIV